MIHDLIGHCSFEQLCIGSLPLDHELVSVQLVAPEITILSRYEMKHCLYRGINTINVCC